MALTREQKKVAKTLIHVGKRVGASPKDIVTALATGLVEANLTNPSSGDGTSVGWRQETSSSYPGVNRQNVAQSAKRFYSELKSAPKGSIGTRAQAVQRSAYPGRYAERAAEAHAIFKQLNRGGVGGGTVAPQKGAQGGKAITQTIPGVDNTKARNLAILDFIHSEKTPLSIAEFGKELKTLKNVPSKQIQVGTLPARSKGSPQAERIQGGPSSSMPLNASKGAIKVGSKVAKMFGLTVTSTTGGTHVPGSYHYQGRAIDIAGSPAQMKKAFKYLQQHVPHGKLTELFYDPIGHYWDNGHKVQGAIGEHSDHVHLAI